MTDNKAIVRHNPVTDPRHYDFPVQPIEYAKPIIAELDGYEGAMVLNIIKYISRFHRKNGVEDVKKARQYCDFLIGYLEEKG